MASVEFAFPVDKIHGKVTKSHKIGFAHRVASKRNYTTSYGKRTTPITDKEKALRAKFTSVAASTRERMLDPTRMPADQAAYAAQSKYKTFYRFLFNMEWAAYEDWQLTLTSNLSPETVAKRPLNSRRFALSSKQ